MEELVRRTGPQLETLASLPMGAPSRVPPVSLRRSHLDSATYRSLVRLLSHCVDSSIACDVANPGSNATRIQEPRGSSAGNDRICEGIDAETGSVEACGYSMDGALGEDRGLLGVLGREKGGVRRGADNEFPGELGSEEPRLGDGSDVVGAKSALAAKDYGFECQQHDKTDAFEPSRDDVNKGFELPDDLISDCTGLIDLIEELEGVYAEEDRDGCTPPIGGSCGIPESKDGVLRFVGVRDEGKIQVGKGCVKETLLQVPVAKNSEMIITRDEMSCLPNMELLPKEMRQDVETENSGDLGLVAELEQAKIKEVHGLCANKTVPEVATNENSNLIVTQGEMNYSAKELHFKEMRQSGQNENSEGLGLVAELDQGKIQENKVCVHEALAEVPTTEIGEMFVTRDEQIPCPDIEMPNRKMRQDEQRENSDGLCSLTVLELGKMQTECNECVTKPLLEVAATKTSELGPVPDERHCSIGEVVYNEMRQDRKSADSIIAAVITTVSEKPAEFKAKDEDANLMKEIMDIVQQEKRFNLDPVVHACDSRKLEENWASSVAASASSSDIEEGEIPNDLQILDQDFLMVNEDSTVEHNKLGDGSGDVSSGKKEHPDVTQATFCSMDIIGDKIRLRETPDKVVLSNTPIHDEKDKFMHASADYWDSGSNKTKTISIDPKIGVKFQAGDPDTSLLSRVVSDKLTIQTKEKALPVKDDEVGIKKRRLPLTEERKAKKKEAKKRKRAQKEREQGVKRLKLHPVLKPKPVIYCDFYLKGRCQQGELCRFSHDTIPLTKSLPCKYFACDTCLKGDDCPFDHQLSKYPCHNFVSKGMCIRGDKCKFSHKILTAEVSSITPKATNTNSKCALEKSILRKQLDGNDKSRVPSDTSKTRVSLAPFSMPKQSEGNLMERTLKPSVRIPDGIRFISFGKGSSGSADLHRNNLPQNHDGKGLCKSTNKLPDKLPPNHAESKVRNLENRDKTSVDERENFLPSGKPLTLASSTILSHPSGKTSVIKEPEQSSISSGSAAGRSSSNLRPEVTEAFEILNEFLFGGQL